MSDPVHALYQAASYPAVSHPSTDPAITAATGRLAGLDVPSPSSARILDIGCSAGHNVFPLAARWPHSRFAGVDFSAAAIADARETARQAGLENVEFHSADLREFDPGNGVEYDFIIAHGFYSWVPAEVRQVLLDFCSTRLSRNGIALISYNTLPGWSLRKSLIDLTRILSERQIAGAPAREPEEILGLLATAAGNRNPYERHLTAVLHDMFGKCENTLFFDDFAPVNDPCTFLDFSTHASGSGLRYLGEAQLPENLPPYLPKQAPEILQSLVTDPLMLQQTIDILTNRTFRSSLLCRGDAVLDDEVASGAVLDLSVRCPYTVGKSSAGIQLVNRAGEEVANFSQPPAVALFSVLSENGQQALPIREVAPSLTELVMDSARKGLVLLRAEPVHFQTTPPEFPDLGPLRLLAARKGHPLVDIYHVPYSPDDARRKIALHMDGTRSIEELTTLANTILPSLDLPAWLTCLASRGMFG